MRIGSSIQKRYMYCTSSIHVLYEYSYCRPSGFTTNINVCMSVSFTEHFKLSVSVKRATYLIIRISSVLMACVFFVYIV